MFDILQVGGVYYVTDDNETFGPYVYAAEAQEKCDEINVIDAYSADAWIEGREEIKIGRPEFAMVMNDAICSVIKGDGDE